MSGDNDSHIVYATRANILTSDPSTTPSGMASQESERSPTTSWDFRFLIFDFRLLKPSQATQSQSENPKSKIPTHP